MKNTIRKMIAGILAVVTMIGAGAAVTAGAETVSNQDAVVTENNEMVTGKGPEVVVPEEKDAIHQMLDRVKEGLKQTDMTKPFTDGVKKEIDQLDIGKDEKQLLKELTDEMTAVTVKPAMYSVPGMGAAGKIINAFDEADKISSSEGVTKLMHTVKAIENGIDAAVTMVPYGGYIIQGKEAVKTVGTYVIKKAIDNSDEIVDTAIGAADTVVDGIKTAGSTIADGASYVADQVGDFFSGVGSKICSWF